MNNKYDNVDAIKSALSGWFSGAKINETDQMGMERQLHQFSINGNGVKCIVSVHEDIIEDYKAVRIFELFSKYELLSEINKNPTSHLIVYSKKLVIESRDK